MYFMLCLLWLLYLLRTSFSTLGLYVLLVSFKIVKFFLFKNHDPVGLSLYMV